jgi:transcriptional regulator with XRE-family HTH domain
MKKINERLLEERLRLGLNKKRMAEAGGVVNSSYTNYEEGRRSPDGDFLAKIAEAGADVQYILTGRRTMDEAEAEVPHNPISDQRKQALFMMFEALGDRQQQEILAAVEEKKQLYELLGQKQQQHRKAS